MKSPQRKPFLFPSILSIEKVAKITSSLYCSFFVHYKIRTIYSSDDKIEDLLWGYQEVRREGGLKRMAELECRKRKGL